MRKEGLEKEENGCLKCKPSPQAADCNSPQTVKVLEATLCPQQRDKGELLNQLSNLYMHGLVGLYYSVSDCISVA